MASSRFVLPWPFSPTSANPSGGGARSMRARLRKSRMASAVSRARDGAIEASPTSAGSARASATAMCLTANEPGRALLEERGHAFVHVVRGGQQPEVRRLELEALVDREIVAAIDGFDAQRHRQRTERDDMPQHSLGFGE